MKLFRGGNRLVSTGAQAPREEAMRNEMPERTARRLIARLKRLELVEATEEARDEAQRLLLARHLGRLRSKARDGLDGREDSYYNMQYE